MRSTTPLAALVLLGAAAAAQRPPALENASALRRPRLADTADTNSWEAYFDYGVAQLRTNGRTAEAAFSWAMRLDPSRAEPLFGRWVAYWMRNPGWFQDYIDGRTSVVESPEVRQVDSLYWRAQLRNPFVPQNLTLVLYDQLEGDFSTDPYTSSWIAYAGGRYDAAARGFSKLIRSDPAKHYQARFQLALCYTAMRQFDSAAGEITALLSEMRRREESRLAHFYQSRELLEYSLGLLEAARGNGPGAREALGRALVENLGFYPAHAEMAELALASGDTTKAVTEYGQAAQFGPEDGVMRFRYAVVLMSTGRLEEAEAELHRAIDLEPLYAPPYFALGALLEVRGPRTKALEAYLSYLDRAPRGASLADRARQRAVALSSGAGDSARRP
jgi:tetratricopeptide (TPR) repeat protein